MQRFLLFILCLLTLSAHADILRIGGTVSDTSYDTAVLRDVGKFIVQELNGEFYNGYQITTDKVTSVEDFIKAARQDKVDIAISSSFATAKYVKNTNMEPALLVNKTGSVFMNSLFITRTESQINSLNDLKGKKLALADDNSTPFYYLPIKTLKESGIKLHKLSGPKDTLWKDAINYFITNNKSEVIKNVYLKKADVGAVCSAFWANKDSSPDFIKDSIRIFHTTESLPGNFLLMKKTLPPAVKTRITQILLKLNADSLARNKIKDCDVKSFHNIGFDWKIFLENVETFRG